jgi:hypothetical protein
MSLAKTYQLVIEIVADTPARAVIVRDEVVQGLEDAKDSLPFQFGWSAGAPVAPPTSEEQKDIDEAIRLAIEEHAGDDINIDADAKVSFNDEGGAWVQAWVYVDMPLPAEPEEPVVVPVESEGGHCD